MSLNAANDINTIASFLAHEQISDLHLCDPVDCIVVCASSVLIQAERVFSALESDASLTRYLVLVGGIGHSTKLIYDAVAKHPKYRDLADKVVGLPESRVLELVMQQHYNVDRITSKGCKILIEDCSTNCGANAIETKKVLDTLGFHSPETCVIVQDPTMSLLTIASFQRAYEGVSPAPKFLACPVFVPMMRGEGQDLAYGMPGVEMSGLWDHQRFYELLLGEVPRLRDDQTGYGPKGKGFIAHVDVPENVEVAWARLSALFLATR